MAQASLNQAVPDEETKMLIEIMQLLKDKDKDYLQVARDALRRDKEERQSNAEQSDETDEETQDHDAAEQNKERKKKGKDQDVAEQNEVTEEEGKHQNAKLVNKHRNGRCSTEGFVQAGTPEVYFKTKKKAAGKRTDISSLEDLDDLWSASSTHTVEWVQGAKPDCEERLIRKSGPLTPKKRRSGPTETVFHDVTGSPISSSSGPSMLPTTPGHDRINSLFHNIRKKQNADPMIKEIIAGRQRKLRESSTINLESSNSQNQQHSTSNIQTRKRPSTAIEIMPPAPKKQRHEDISTSSRGDLPPQSPGMQAAHRLLEKMKKSTDQVDPLKKKLPKPSTAAKRAEETTNVPKKKVKQSAASGTVKPKVSLYPCDICGVFIRERLDRHYVNAHKLEREKAKRRSRVQKAISLGSKKVSTCSLCGKVVAHLPEHLANMHQIERKDELSHQMRRDARKVSIEEQLSLTGPSPRVTAPKNKKVVSIVIINAFIDWLPTMKGKKTTKKSAKQHGAQALKVWRGLTTQEEAEETPLNLEDIKSEEILEYVEHQRLQMKPGTLRSYLCSFVYFLEFLDSSSCDQKDLNKEQLEVLIKETKNYNRNLRDDVAQRKTEFALQEHEELLPASAVSDYLESYHLDTMETTTFKGEVFDGILTYCGIRDALMAMLVCTNGHRTSAIRDIRPSNVFQAKDENGMKVFGVSSHKTSASRGVANFSLTPKQFLVMKEFATQTMQAGETLNRASNKPMFVTYAGNDMTASNAAQSVRKALSRSGVLETLNRKDPKFTATMVRKLITTLVRDEEPELAGPLAQQLGHTEGTGANFYQLKQSQKRSAVVVKKIHTTISTAAAKEKGITGATTSSEEEGHINAESFTTTEVEEEGTISAESVTPTMVEEEGTIIAESVTTTEVANEKDISNEHAEETTTIKKSAETPANFNDILEQENPFSLPEKKEFIKTMVSFCKSEKSDELTREAVKMEIEYKKDPWGTVLETRRYKITEKFETIVKTVHNIELSTTLGKLIPKSKDADPSIQSNLLLMFASELANYFLKTPVDLSARDIRQQIPFGELVSLLNLPMHKNKQAITTTELKKTVTAHDQTRAEEQNVVEKDIAEDKIETTQDSQIKKKVYWAPEDTKAVELLFHQELLDGIAETHRVTKKVTVSKANSSAAGRSLIEKYGTKALYEKLYSIIRPKLKKAKENL